VEPRLAAIGRSGIVHHDRQIDSLLKSNQKFSSQKAKESPG
jgi:hypothetical protein